MYTLFAHTFSFSERIGWIPEYDQVPLSIKDEYKWIEGLSVTEMEILHGAYRVDNPNGNTSFYFLFHFSLATT